ncbi:maximins 3/H3 type 1 [Striga asiatica]|uniref:Maximins 3/H3 type 1 n=1 Tax=Striga asiatica TaxID=4170 RepID=A0A5A7R3D8_STRAF|nr:maximins 3/H3 type 1 [Striga asiatica]
MEMEAQIKLKNFEVARLWDRLCYYKAVNQEMSQRNQEVVEETRRLRQIRKRRQKWIWGSIATAVTLGSAVFAYSYLHSGKTSEIPLHTTVSDNSVTQNSDT